MDFVCSWLSRYNLQSAMNSTLETHPRHASQPANVPFHQSRLRKRQHLNFAVRRRLVEVLKAESKEEVEQQHAQQHKGGKVSYRVTLQPTIPEVRF